MKANFDVLIVGGGIVGATLACALGDTRLKVGLLDRRGPPAVSTDYDLRVSAITLASRTLFQNLDVWSAIERRRASPVEAMEIWENDGTLRFEAAEIGEPCLAYIVENSVMLRALLERAALFTNVAVLSPVDITGMEITEDHAVVNLQEGRALHARLVVGADGADSAVRRAAGIDQRRHDLEQKGIVATVQTEKVHGRVARQHFLTTGPLAFLPLDEPNTSSIVWSVDTERAQVLVNLDEQAFGFELMTAFGDRLGRVVSVSRREAFDLSLASASVYTAPRLALVGDAAHTVHPLAGQGLNLGLLDAAALAENVLESFSRGRDIGEHARLRRYERARKTGNLGMMAVTGGFKYLFGNSWPLFSQLRSRGLGLADKFAPVKRIVMRRAAGLEGELPELVRPKRV